MFQITDPSLTNSIEIDSVWTFSFDLWWYNYYYHLCRDVHFKWYYLIYWLMCCFCIAITPIIFIGIELPCHTLFLEKLIVEKLNLDVFQVFIAFELSVTERFLFSNFRIQHRPVETDTKFFSAQLDGFNFCHHLFPMEPLFDYGTVDLVTFRLSSIIP